MGSDKALDMDAVKAKAVGSAAKDGGVDTAGAADMREAALIAARAADSKKAVDVLVQDVGPFIGVTDHFVIATASNPRQVDAVIDQVEEDLREKAGLKPFNREISADSSWSLLDYGGIVVHVFMPEAREYYRLEQLWPEAELIDLEAEEGFENLEYTDRVARILGTEASGVAEGEVSIGEEDAL